MASEEFEVQQLTRELARDWLACLCEIDRDTLGEHWDETHWLFNLPGKWQLSRIALERGVLRGFIVASHRPGTVHIHRMAVHRDARGRGLGATLLRTIACAAMQSGCPMLSLKVDARNLPARRLYATFGFTMTNASALNLVMTAASCRAAATPPSDEAQGRPRTS